MRTSWCVSCCKAPLSSKQRPARSHFLLALACVIGPAALFGQSPSEMDSRIARLDASLDVLRRVYSIPSLSAAVVFEQRIIWEKGFGFQDIARRLSARPDTPYRTASLTKTFTSALLMQCVEQGTLSLDEPIRQDTAGIPEPGATVRHVLTHTSEGGPGSRFHYNGNRYAELTPVVERCTGEPFRLALARRVLDRLAMRDSVPGQDLDSPTPSLRQMFDAGTLSGTAVFCCAWPCRTRARIPLASVRLSSPRRRSMRPRGSCRPSGISPATMRRLIGTC